MFVPRLLGAAGLAALCATGAMAADCVPSSALRVELELLGCQPAEIAIADRIAGADLWWLRPYLESVARGNPGVVLRGKILRFRELDRPVTALPWEVGEGLEEELFYTTSDPDFCGTFDGIEILALIREEPCCDIVPPANVACVLDVAEVRAASPPAVVDADGPAD